eukprot:Phypoly_transcript_20187.p1 GENE.Phypoly_transcript_20187~~Phypoly_transcript_20187.p1  ORF type:complete len:194 (+),score=22.59 Phypoly_transcript_20187:69-584(+)
MKIVRPTTNGTQFVCASYSHLYHWDMRANEMVRKVPLFTEFTRTGYDYLPSLFVIKNDSEGFFSSRYPAKTVLYTFPDLIPSPYQFPITNVAGVYMNDIKGIGCTDDTLFLLNSVSKEVEILPWFKPKRQINIWSFHWNEISNTFAFLNCEELFCGTYSTDNLDEEDLNTE